MGVLRLILAASLLSTTLAFVPTTHRLPTRVHRTGRGHIAPVQCNLFEGFQSFLKSLTVKADASHILIKGGEEAALQLENIKTEIGDSPVAFAEAAAKYSSCPSGSRGGNLGEFGKGAMVPEFDKVVFAEEVGKVHGPIRTQFGYHLILINSRSD